MTLASLPLNKLYLAWICSNFIAVVIGVIYYITGMLLEYGSVQSEDFEGLVYFLTGIIVTIFVHGCLLAIAVKLFYKQYSQSKVLAKNILLLYTICAFLLLVTFQFAAFIFVNPILPLILLTLPWLAHNLTYSRKRFSPALITILIFISIFVAYVAFGWILLITSGPPNL